MKFLNIHMLVVLLQLITCVNLIAINVSKEVRDEEEVNRVVEMLDNAETKVKGYLKSLTRAALPYMIRITEETNLSSSCIEAGSLFLRDFRLMKPWTIKLMDSFGKLPAGVLGMTQWIQGDYDQCLSIEIPRNKKITNSEKKHVGGKYCALKIGLSNSIMNITKSIHHFENNSLIKLAKDIVKPAKLGDFFKNAAKMKMGIRLDVCIPNTCSDNDLKSIGNWIFGTAVDLNVEYCKTKDEKLKYTNGQLISLTVLCIFIAWVSMATLAEILMRFDIMSSKMNNSKIFEYILIASPFTSLHKLCLTNIDESTKSMCGVRCLVIINAVLGHTYALVMIVKTVAEKYSNLIKAMDFFAYEILLEAFTMIESFFFYSGFMVMYLRQKRGKNSAKQYIISLVKKIFRFTFPVIFVLGFAILLPLLGDGPHWHRVIDQAEYLENNWWKYITHVHIYIAFEQKKFFNVIWFMSVLLQLSIIASLLLYVKDRWPRSGSLVIVLLMLTGIITHAVDVLSNRYYAMFGVPAVSEKTHKYVRHHYSKPYYSHLSTFCFGALIGDILNKKKEITFGKITLFVCWIGCIILMALSIFGVHNYKKDILANENIIIAFQCIAPFAWTIGLAWLTVACMTGYGGKEIVII
ncbi:nose resistant to fluoxetine protein 6-like [Centruroides sculpturatus]|uniref:nose resistant to fluoxetine protein 6-like n=1 Tax=Centruroides sculpturatus TaxID=218467 RepID=UPI000C6E717E|nr:nose resistant to fluoxetine protein 6-like [Centruroides sculpturatus]